MKNTWESHEIWNGADFCYVKPAVKYTYAYVHIYICLSMYMRMCACIEKYI